MSIGAWIVSVILIILAGRIVVELSKISESVLRSQEVLNKIESNTSQILGWEINKNTR